MLIIISSQSVYGGYHILILMTSAVKQNREIIV